MQSAANPIPSPPMLDIVQRIMHRNGRSWKTPAEIQSAILCDYGRWTSDAAVTARLRELRNSKGYDIKSRPRKERSSWEYRLMK